MKNFIKLLIVNFRFFSNLSNKMYQFILFVEPFFNLLVLSLLSNLSGNTLSSDSILYSGIMGAITFSLYSSGSILVIEKWNSTMELLEATPTRLFKIVLSKALTNALLAIISLLINLLYAIFFFKVKLNIENPIQILLLTFILLLFSLTSLGSILAVIFGQNKNAMELQNLLLVPLILFSGVWVRSIELPNWAIRLVNISPVKWSIDCILESIEREKVSLRSFVYSIVSSLIVIIITYVAIGFLERNMKEKGKYNEF